MIQPNIARTKDRVWIFDYPTSAKHGLDQFTVLFDAFFGRVWLPSLATLT